MIKTGYSFHHAYGHLRDVVSRVKEIGWTAAPIADLLSTFGYVRWTKACEKEGLKPVYGVTIPCCVKLGEKKQTLDDWQFFAIDSLRPLHDLIALATWHPGRIPSLTYEEALSQDGVFVVAGERLQVDLLPPVHDRFFGALSPATPKGLVSRMRRDELPLVATSVNFYPRARDKELYRVALGKNRSNTQTYPMWIMSDDELREYLAEDFGGVDAAFVNRNMILDRCNAKMKKAKLLAPERPATLDEMCAVGAAAKGIDLSDEVYRKRLERELSVIREKEFEDYFYILTDIIAFAKAHMVVGPARGSSCGSLVCYLLGITAIDPIPFGLIFERFIDVNRQDLPDVDIDFSDVNRNLVFAYAEQKYGKDRVARLGTVGMLQAKSSLNAAAAALRIPSWRINQISDSIIVRQPGDARFQNTLEDTLKETDAGRSLVKDYPEIEIAAQLEGHPQNASQHAAGLLLTAEPIAEFVAVHTLNRGAWCDLKDAETLNLLKIDALGLTQLSIFERTLELIGQKPVSGWLETLPTNDSAAFEVLNQKKYSGIFQFAGMTVRSLASKIKFEKLEDLIAVSAIARPGSMDSGGADAWIRRHNGEKIPSFHPIYDRITAETYGVIVYQETVMFLCRELAGFSWPDTSVVRKAIGKKLGHEELESWRSKFVNGCVAVNGLSEHDASNIWTNIVTFGTYGFNKCIDGETPIRISNANAHLKNPTTIAELYEKYHANPKIGVRQKGLKPMLASLFPDGRGYPQKAVQIIKSGTKDCFKYTFDDGSFVICTPEHRFLINSEWLSIQSAKIGSEFTSLKYVKTDPKDIKGYVTGRGKDHSSGNKYGKTQDGFPSGEDNPSWTNGITAFKKEFVEAHSSDPCEECGAKAKRMEAHHNDFNSGRERPSDLVWLCASCHKKRHYSNGRKKRFEKGYEQVTKTLVSIEHVGMRDTYDIEMPEHHNFVLGNGLVTHNSHAVAYGLISYWCCYLKAKFPVAFGAATLDAEVDAGKQIELLRELAAEGVSYLPVDIERSTERWTISGNNLLGPLTSIKGIGSAKVLEILNNRKNGVPLKPGVLKKLSNTKTEIDSLYPIEDRIKFLHPDLDQVAGHTPIKIHEVQPGKRRGDFVVLARINRITPKDENDHTMIEKRGYALKGPIKSVNLFVGDDTDEIFAKIDRRDYDYALLRQNEEPTTLGKEFTEKAKAGKSLYAIEGRCPPDFRMIKISRVRYLGEMDD